MAKEGVKRLAEMQNADGGWGWFSGLEEKSWPDTTATVVRGLLIARDNGVALPDEMLMNGIEWLKRFQALQIEKIKNVSARIEPFKSCADGWDALVFHVLAEAGFEELEMRELLLRDCANLSPRCLCLFALGAKDEPCRSRPIAQAQHRSIF